MGIKVQKFGADWCGPCKMLDPILKELDQERQDVDFEFVDVEEEPELAAEKGVMGVPRVFIYKDNELIDEFTGFRPKEFIESILNNN